MPVPYRFPAARTARKTGASTLKEAIGDLLNAYQIRSKFNETFITTHWEQLMGRTIAARTSRVFINNRKLYVQVDSAPLKNELMMARSKMVDLLNREVGEEVIDEIVFV